MKTKFSERIKELRKENNISQTQLTQNVGYDRTTIYNWENKSVQPPYEVLLDVAIFFNVSTDYLLGKVDFE